MERVAALRQTKLFAELDEKELAWVARRAAGLHFLTGEMIFFSGEEGKGLFVVSRGRVRVFQQNLDGREQVMHVDTAGATIAEVPVFDGGPYPASAIAEEDTDVLFIDKRDIHEFCMKHPAFAMKALKMMAERVRKHAQLVEVLSFHEVGQRLALFLLGKAQDAGGTPASRVKLELSLSNHEIAARIGSVRDVVSRALARLQHEGLVVVESRTVTIVDTRALRLYVDKRHSGAKPLSPPLK
ncbi:MAG: Crp/Fnr family transcriptional regulator [Edaphobacter sp.]